MQALLHFETSLRWRRVLLVLYGVMFLLFLGDRRTSGELMRMAWVTMALAALVDRSMDWRMRWRPVSIAYAFTVLIALFAGIAITPGNGAARHFLYYQNWAIWLIDLWLAWPLLAAAARPLRVLIILLLLFCWWCMLSAFASPDAPTAMKMWGREIGMYAGIFSLTVRLFLVELPGEKLLIRLCTGVMLLVTVLMLCVVAAAHLPATATWLAAREWIRVEPLDPNAPWRLQFPFQHHNRVGYFACVACFVFVAMAAVAHGRTWRAVWVAAALGAMIALSFTATRGAMLAVAAGLLIAAAGMCAQRGRRRWLLMLLLVPGLYFLLPAGHRSQIQQMFDLSSYRPGTTTTMGTRQLIWQGASGFIAADPVLGLGYGFETFEEAFEKQYPAKAAVLEGVSHAHNMWIETSVESGVPAALLLLVFMGLRVCWLAGRCYSRDRTGASGYAGAPAALLTIWLAVEIAVAVYGLSNYPLRRNIGLATYVVWAVGVIMVWRSGAGVRVAQVSALCSPPQDELPSDADLRRR